MAMMTSFADLKAFNNERIKNTLTVYDNNLNNAAGQAMYFKLSQNNVTFEDSILSNSQTIEHFNYINVRMMENTITPHDFLPGYECSMLFYADEDVKVSTRTVMTIFDALSQCGGLLGTMTALSQMIVAAYNRLHYTLQLLGDSIMVHEH